MANTQNLGVVAPVPMREWNDTTIYQKLSIVRYNNSCYIAIQENQGIIPTVTVNWQNYWMLLISSYNISDVPTRTSQLINDSGFVTNTVANLINYYLKTETYNKSEVNDLIGAIKTGAFQRVDELPDAGESNIIYLVPSQASNQNNIYDEYIYFNSIWEIIGSTEINLSEYAKKSDLSNYVLSSELLTILSNYVKNTDYASNTNAGVVKINTNTTYGSMSGIYINSSGQLYLRTNDAYGTDLVDRGQICTSKASIAQINAKTNNYKPIVPSTLDYAVKTSLTTNSYTLTDFEKNAIQVWLGLKNQTYHHMIELRITLDIEKDYISGEIYLSLSNENGESMTYDEIIDYLATLSTIEPLSTNVFYEVWYDDEGHDAYNSYSLTLSNITFNNENNTLSFSGANSEIGTMEFNGVEIEFAEDGVGLE